MSKEYWVEMKEKLICANCRKEIRGKGFVVGDRGRVMILCKKCTDKLVK